MLTLIITVLLGIYSLSAALHALLTKRDSNSAITWVAFCLFLPLLGPTVYLIFGINRTLGKAQRTYLAEAARDPSDSICEPANCNLRPLSLVGEHVTGNGLRSCDDIQLLQNGEALYPAMLDAIEAAKISIYCASYIFAGDETGDKFANAFMRAQERGVDVRVIIDGLGAVLYRPSISKKLHKLGLKVRHFNPVSLFPPSLSINMRNHRKLTIVDGKIAFTGGQNIGDRHLVEKPGNKMPTRDLHFKFTGKIVDDLSRSFLKDWDYSLGIRKKRLFEPKNTNLDESDIWTRLVLDGPNEYLDKLNEVLVGTFSTAQQRIWIMTPYFLPNISLVSAIVGARLRGVDVKILLPERTNIYMAHWAAQHGLGYILSKELEVHLQPSPFIHTKAILIDDNYALIGSANMDARSLRLNYELGVEIFSPKLNAELSDYFESQLERCIRLDEERLQSRPNWMKIRDALAWLFSPYL